MATLFRAADREPILCGEGIYHGQHPQRDKYPYRLDVRNVVGQDVDPCITDVDLARVHSPAYLARLRNPNPEGTRFSQAMGNDPALLNWQHATAVGSALYRAILYAYSDNGSAVALSGGYHHAFPGHAEGLCFINDIAVALLKFRHNFNLGRILIVDLDCHQANGTAACLANIPGIDLVSFHREDLGFYPFIRGEKSPRTLRNELLLKKIMLEHEHPALRTVLFDQFLARLAELDNDFLAILHENPYLKMRLADALCIPPEDAEEIAAVFTVQYQKLDYGFALGTTYGGYRYRLKETLAELTRRSQKIDLALYVNGADVLASSEGGNLDFTLADMANRDRLIFEFFRENQIPFVTIYAGGYGPETHQAFRQSLVIQRS